MFTGATVRPAAVLPASKLTGSYAFPTEVTCARRATLHVQRIAGNTRRISGRKIEMFYRSTERQGEAGDVHLCNRMEFRELFE